MEMTAVIYSTGRILGATAAAMAVALFAFGASAQDAKTDTKKAPAKTEKKVACNSLKAETTCTGRSDCNWVAEKKDDKGKTRKAYCRANPTTKKSS